MALSAAERTLRARAAAYSLHAQGGTSTAAGTAAFLERFRRQVDPTGALDPAERERRAALAVKAYMCGLALKAARRKREKATGSMRSAPVAQEVRRDRAEPRPAA